MKLNFLPQLQMEIGTLAGAGIAAGISALSAGGQAYAQGKTNRKTRQWNEMMYAKQRADAAADWDKVNAYNSPAQQMKRYKEAGLNPNLIYGQSTDSGPIRSTDVKPWTPDSPDISGFGAAAQVGLQAYQDLTIQQEQVKNMQQQRQNMVLDAALKTLTATALDQKNAQAQSLNPIAVQTAAAALDKLQLDTNIAAQNERRTQSMFPEQMEQAILKTIQMRADNEGKKIDIEKAKQDLANLKKDGTLKELEIELKKKGMSWSDPLWLRALAQFYPGKDLPGAVRELIKDVKSAGKAAFDAINPF